MNYIRQLLQQNQAEGRKSSVLRDPKMVVVSLLGAVAVLSLAGAPVVIIYGCAVGAAVVLLVMLWAFVKFAKTDPDRLQSESFVLNRTAIERMTYGSHESGMQELPEGDGALEGLVRARDRVADRDLS